jgi:hypothetical protein
LLELSWIHLVILVLASFRLTHLIVFDEITSFIRAPFITITQEEDKDGQIVQQIEIKGTGLRRWVGKLLSCYWCVGIWSSTLIIALYCWVPASFVFLVILAVAGAAAVIESKV